MKKDTITYKFTRSELRKRPEKPYKILIKDLFYVKYLLSKFDCLNTGTKVLRTQNLAEITLILNPHFFFNNHNFENEEQKIEFTYHKCFRFFNVKKSIDKLINENKTKEHIKAEIAESTVNDFFESVETYIEKDTIFDKFKFFDKGELKYATRRKIENKVKITLLDLLYTQKLIQNFTCLQIGSIDSKIKNLSELTLLLNPDFIFTEDLKNEKEKYDFIQKKANRIFSMNCEFTIEQRINQLKNRNSLDEFIKDELLVEKFIESNKEIMHKNSNFEKYHVWDDVKVENLIRSKYLTAFTRQIYSFDTVQICEGFQLTILTDNASRKIVAAKVTKNPPRADHLTDMIRKQLTPELLKRCKIIHCDRTGANISNEFRLFCKKTNIKLSYTVEANMNQVAESNNNTIKKIILERNFEDFPSDIEFKLLPNDLKLQIVEHSIKVYNTMPTEKTSKALQGYPRQFIDSTKEFFYLINPEIIDMNPPKFENAESKEGEILALWNGITILTYRVCLKQILLKIEYFINFPVLNKTILSQIQLMHQGSDLIQLKEVKQKVLEKQRVLDFILNKCYQLTLRGFDNYQVNDEIKQILNKNYLVAKTIREKENSYYYLNLFTDHEAKNKIQLLENEKLERNGEVQKRLKRISELKKIALTSVYQQDRRERDLIWDEKIRRRKLLIELKSQEEISITNEDFFLILKSLDLDESMSDFTRSKFKLAHGILKITGRPISNLIHYNMDQVDNLFNKRIVILKLPNGDYFEFPYVKEIEKFLKPLRNNYKILKRYQELKPESKFFKIDKNSKYEFERLRSELWGYSEAPTLIKAINAQLRKASLKFIKPHKNITSRGYRIDFGRKAVAEKGVMKGKAALGLKNTTSAEAYLNSNFGLDDIEDTLKSVHSSKEENKKMYGIYVGEEKRKQEKKFKEISKNKIEFNNSSDQNFLNE